MPPIPYSPLSQLAAIMSRSTGLPQHLLVVDLRPECAERIIGYARQAGLAVRTTRADTLDQALRHAETTGPDVVVVSFDGPADWSFEAAMSGLVKLGHRPLVVADRLDDGVVARSYSFGAQGVIPSAASDALVSALRWSLSISADRRALSKAEAIQAETATREESLLDSSRDPVAYIHEGMHIKANQAYLDFFGIEDADEIEGMPFLDLVDDDFSQDAKVCLKAASRGEIPPNGIDLKLVSAENGPQITHIEISSAAYEGEPCLQLTLRVGSTSSSQIAITGDASMGASAWWERVEATHSSSVSSILALVSLSDMRADLSPVALPQRAFVLSRIEDEVRAVVLKSGGEQVDRQSIINLGMGIFGVLIPVSDADMALETISALHAGLLDIHIQEGPVSITPHFNVAGVAIGTAIEWEGVSEAFSMLDGNLERARTTGSLAWFDPSTTGRLELANRRELIEAVRLSCHDESRVTLKFRPIMPLAGDPIPLYEVCPYLTGPNNQLLGPDVFEKMVIDAGLSSVLDETLARTVNAALQAKIAKNKLKLLVRFSPSILKEETTRAQCLLALKDVAPHVVIQIDEDDLLTRPDLMQGLRSSLQAVGMDMGISEFGEGPSSAALLDQAQPQWLKFSEHWSGDKLRDPEQQKAFRMLIQAANSVNCRTIADFVKDSQSMSALFSAGVAHAAGDFLSPIMDGMNAEFTV